MEGVRIAEVMRWEGAARRSEGSRAWGRKHCRGRDEGSTSNRSLRSPSPSQNEAVLANPRSPPPTNEMSSLEAEYSAPRPCRPQPGALSTLKFTNDEKCLRYFYGFSLWCIIKYICVLVVISKGARWCVQGRVCSSLGYSLLLFFVLFSCSRYRDRLGTASRDRV